jgi:hypothetical protein
MADLASWPIYEIVILSCIAVASPKITRQLTVESLVAQPITVCVVGLLVAVVMSHLSHFFLWGARMAGFDFLKVLLYYLLFVGVIDSIERLRRFLSWLVAFTVVLCALAILQHFGVVNIISSAARVDEFVDYETGEKSEVTRICSTGIFNDPNDLAMILVVGMVFSAHRLTDSRFGALSMFWLVPIGLFGYAFALTHSRGGMLALISAVLAFTVARYSWKRAAVLGLLIVPILFAVFAGRQTDFEAGLDHGTGMERIQLWAMGLGLLRQNPLFGTGYGTFAEHLGHVAHNSYVNAFTELGIAGGTLFLGAYLIAIKGIWQIAPEPGVPPELVRLRPYLLAAVVSYGAAMLSLSREGVVPTYMILALATVSLRLYESYSLSATPRFDQRLIKLMALASIVFIAVTYVFIRLFARWG